MGISLKFQVTKKSKFERPGDTHKQDSAREAYGIANLYPTLRETLTFTEVIDAIPCCQCASLFSKKKMEILPVPVFPANSLLGT